VYAALAEALQLPWRIIADGDTESEKFKKQLSKRGFNQADIDGHVMILPAGNNLEGQLLADGQEGLLRSILQELAFADALTCTLDELKAHLRKCKMDCASALAKRVIKDPSLAEQMPAPFVATIKALKDGTL
jgi:putative ATP-dependent endonuclease of the OLD family